MEEKLVSRGTAKLLKEKGFDIKCLWWYDLSTNKLSCFENSYRYQQRQLEKEINTPTQSLAQKWLREKHQLHITIFSSSQESWMYRITKPHQKLEEGLYGEDFYTYEECLEKGLIEALKLIK